MDTAGDHLEAAPTALLLQLAGLAVGDDGTALVAFWHGRFAGWAGDEHVYVKRVTGTAVVRPAGEPWRMGRRFAGPAVAFFLSGCRRTR